MIGLVSGENGRREIRCNDYRYLLKNFVAKGGRERNGDSELDEEVRSRKSLVPLMEAVSVGDAVGKEGIEGLFALRRR